MAAFVVQSRIVGAFQFGWDSVVLMADSYGTQLRGVQAQSIDHVLFDEEKQADAEDFEV